LAIVPNEQSQEGKKQKVIDETWKILAGFAGSEPSVVLNYLSTYVETAYKFCCTAKRIENLCFLSFESWYQGDPEGQTIKLPD
jgi:hypothetical protein